MTSPAVVDGVDIDAVAAAVRACSAVQDLYSTAAASVASYLPGRQVAGLRVGPDAVTVQVRSYWGVPVLEVAAQVRTAVLTLAAGRSVDVVIADITDAPPAPLQPSSPAISPGPRSSAAARLLAPPVPEAPAPAPATAALVLPVDVTGEQAEQDEVVWTTSTADADGRSSAPIIPTGAETPPPSLPA